MFSKKCIQLLYLPQRGVDIDNSKNPQNPKGITEGRKEQQALSGKLKHNSPRSSNGKTF